MRKNIIIVLCLILVFCSVGIFGGCNDGGGGGLGTTDDTPVELRIANWANAGSQNEYMGTVCFTNAFTKKYPNVTFKIDIISDYVNQFQNLMAAGKSNYDVFMVHDGTFGSWVGTGVMKDLTDLINDSELINPSEMLGNVADRFRYDPDTHKTGEGKYYCVPKDLNPYVMYYNKTLLKDLVYGSGENAGQSVFDVYEEYLTAEDYFPLDVALDMWRDIKTLGGGECFPVGGYSVDGLVWSAGSDYLDTSLTPAKSNLMSDEVVNAYELYVSMYKEGLLPDGASLESSSSTGLFEAGSMACYVNSRYFTNTYRTITGFEWDCAPIPGYDKDVGATYASGSNGFAIHVNSKNQYWGWKFVEFVGSMEGQIAATQAGFNIPFYDAEYALDVLLSLEEDKLPTNTMAFVYAAKKQRIKKTGILPYSTGWVSTLNSEMSYAFLKDTDPSYRSVRACLKSASAKIEAEIANDYNLYLI